MPSILKTKEFRTPPSPVLYVTIIIRILMLYKLQYYNVQNITHGGRTGISERVSYELLGCRNYTRVNVML